MVAIINNGMTRARFIVATSCIVVATALGGCGALDKTYTYRYRMTVEIETPQGLKTGSSVQEQTVTKHASPQLGSGNVRNIETRGEAVAVDLGGGQILFVLLCDSSLTQSVLDPQWKNDWVESGQRISARKTPQEPLAMSAQGSKYWGWSTGYPMLVRFKDIRDPKSVEKVTPNDIAKSFGPGVKLRRITVQITDDPVTTGIEKRLGWLERQQGSLRPADLTSSEETKQLSVVTDTSFWQGVNQ